MNNAAAARVLDRAADLISPKGAWTQGANFRDKDGRPFLTGSKVPASFCVLGAISESADEPSGGESRGWSCAYDALEYVLGTSLISHWNDSPKRTQGEVVAALRKAAAYARGDAK